LLTGPPVLLLEARLKMLAAGNGAEKHYSWREKESGDTISGMIDTSGSYAATVDTLVQVSALVLAFITFVNAAIERAKTASAATREKVLSTVVGGIQVALVFGGGVAWWSYGLERVFIACYVLVAAVAALDFLRKPPPASRRDILFLVVTVAGSLFLATFFEIGRLLDGFERMTNILDYLSRR
jgi:hypothetical protein